MNDDAEAQPPRALSPWVIAAAMVPPILVCVGILNIVPQFEDVFRNFGAELPWPTVLFARYTGFVLGWPLIVAMLALAWRHERRRTVPLLLLSGGFSLLLHLAMMAAMYLPIYKLAASP